MTIRAYVVLFGTLAAVSWLNRLDNPNYAIVALVAGVAVLVCGKVRG